MSKWSKECIIQSIQNFYKEHQRIPLQKDFEGVSEYPSKKTVRRYFGTWESAIQESGFVYVDLKWNRDKVIKAIQSFYNENQKIPTTSDFINNQGKYPGYQTVVHYFGLWNLAIEAAGYKPYLSNKEISSDEILESIQNFFAENGRIPQRREFTNNVNYPSSSTVIRYFGTWNNAITSSGFDITLHSMYGIPTLGLDNTLYRSKTEAYFADKLLYNKFTYFYETRYPSKLWLYDFYIKELDLYIEIDGEFKEEKYRKRIKEKMEFNKLNSIKCKFIKATDVFKIRELS